MESTFKKNLALTISKFCFYFIDFYITFKKQRIKNGGHLTNFLSGAQNLPLPTHIFRMIQYKTLWSVLLKYLALTISKFCFYSIDFLYNLLEKRIKNGGRQTNFRLGEQNLPLPPHILGIIQYNTLRSVRFVIV